MPLSDINRQHQFGALVALDLLSDLFTISKKEQFSREEILVIINWAKNDSGIISVEVMEESAVIDEMLALPPLLDSPLGEPHA